jgi:hypothetical protein
MNHDRWIYHLLEFVESQKASMFFTDLGLTCLYLLAPRGLYLSGYSGHRPTYSLQYNEEYKLDCVENMI